MNPYTKKELHAITVELIRGLILTVANNHSAFAAVALLEHAAFDRPLDESWGPYPRERLGGFLLGMLRDPDRADDLLYILAWREPTP